MIFHYHFAEIKTESQAAAGIRNGFLTGIEHLENAGFIGIRYSRTVICYGNRGGVFCCGETYCYFRSHRSLFYSIINKICNYLLYEMYIHIHKNRCIRRDKHYTVLRLLSVNVPQSFVDEILQ